MFSYHFRIKSGKKGTGAEHAAYISRRGTHCHREDLVHASHGNLPDWAENNPRAFWKAADTYERSNGAVYRELEIALPNELDKNQNVTLAERLVRELIGNKPYEYAIHAPEGKLSGLVNTHLHAMYSDRVPDGIRRPPESTFARHNAAQPEKGGCRKDSGGKTRLQVRDELVALRQKVATIINDALAEHGVDARVDHRSLRDQGQSRRPEAHQGAVRVNRMSKEARADYVSQRESARVG